MIVGQRKTPGPGGRNSSAMCIQVNVDDVTRLTQCTQRSYGDENVVSCGACEVDLRACARDGVVIGQTQQSDNLIAEGCAEGCTCTEQYKRLVTTPLLEVFFQAFLILTTAGQQLLFVERIYQQAANDAHIKCSQAPYDDSSLPEASLLCIALLRG